jgi:hypothetical protein
LRQLWGRGDDPLEQDALYQSHRHIHTQHQDSW